MIVSGVKAASHASEFLNFFPYEIRRICHGLNFSKVQEIRMRLGKPLCIFFDSGVGYITGSGKFTQSTQDAFVVRRCDIDDALSLISRSSVYAYEEEIAQGYITIPGGHRVGICGKTVSKDGKVYCMKEISGLNYRFAKQINGCGRAVVEAIEQNQSVKNTLIVSPPQCGKTTMLRDIALNLSLRGYKVLIVDERCEIAAMCNGISSYDLGVHTDVLDGCAKTDGMIMGLRSMSPQVIITDEIGTSADIDAIVKAACCGVSVITTIHAQNRFDLEKRDDLHGICRLFDCVVTLSNKKGCGTIEEIYINGG